MLEFAFSKAGPFTSALLPPTTTAGSPVRCIVIHDNCEAVAGRLPEWDAQWHVIGTMGLAGGESIKTWEQLHAIWEFFATCGADRNTYIICIGGGSLSDLVGFAAGCYHRGLPLILIPTTALAMVDAAIGGKNGINWKGAKNQIGMRHMPDQILLQSHWLDTLSSKEQISGWIEMAKHALTDSPASTEQFFAEVGPNPASWARWIPVSAQFKWKITLSDPDEKGLRKVLNFGHTVGHGLEAVAQEEGRELPHGIAVAWGIETALHLSVALRGLPSEQAQWAIRKLRTWLGPERPPEWEGERVWPYMLKDKKNENGQVMEVLLRDWGQPEWNCPVPFEEFSRAWKRTQAGPES